MKFKLENPQHQITAINSVVEIFRGMEKNTYDNAHVDDIHSNVCSLSQQDLMDNIKRVIAENKVPVELHIYPFGGHGLSTCDKHTCDNVTEIMTYNSAWLDSMKKWLQIIFK